MRYFIGKMALVGIIQIAISLLLYAGRTKSSWAIFHSDLVVFTLPMTLAFFGYCRIAWPHILKGYYVRLWVVVLIGLGAMGLSEAIMMTIAHSMFGS